MKLLLFTIQLLLTTTLFAQYTISPIENLTPNSRTRELNQSLESRLNFDYLLNNNTGPDTAYQRSFDQPYGRRINRPGYHQLDLTRIYNSPNAYINPQQPLFHTSSLTSDRVHSDARDIMMINNISNQKATTYQNLIRTFLGSVK